MNTVTWVQSLVLAALGVPFVLLGVLGGAFLFGMRPSERQIGISVASVLLVALGLLIAASLVFSALDVSRIVIALGSWYETEGTGFHLDLLVDRHGLWAAMRTLAIAGVVAAFSHRYLHFEPNYPRFFVLFMTFVCGLLLVDFAGTIEVLFTGWEMLGIASSLLVAFYHEREAPVRNAWRVFVVYRIGDAALLSAAILLHHMVGSGSLAVLFGGQAAGEAAVLSDAQATLVCGLIIVAVAGKCAQLPFSSWLPRAMEGPTSSSAVFYGALSVHAGAFLMLRAAPLLEQSSTASWMLGALGLATAIYASLVIRAQTDIKSSLAFASMAQVGIILCEIALGWHTLAMLHVTGHACLRLLQFLRAPNLLHDVRDVEDAVGAHINHAGPHPERLLPSRSQRWLYAFALERGFLEPLLDALVVRPFVATARFFDRCEQAWCRLIGASNAPSATATSQGTTMTQSKGEGTEA